MGDFWGLLPQTLQGNDFFNGGFVLMIIGSLLAFARKLPQLIVAGLLSRLTTRVIVDSREEAFVWFQKWLSLQDYGKRARRIMVKIRNETEQRLSQPSNLVVKGEGWRGRSRSKLKIYFTLAPGQHIIRYNSKWIYMRYSQERMGNGSNEGNFSMGLFETIEIRYFGTNREIINQIYEEAERSTLPNSGNYVDIYVNRYGSWYIAQRSPVRSPESLIYTDGLYSDIRATIAKFLNSKEWYQEMGIPYRLGLLFYGPQGNGKSSLIKTLAGEFGKSFYMLNLADKSLDQRDFPTLLMNAEPGSFVLMEDVHLIQNQFGDMAPSLNSNDISVPKLDFSTFINTIDGVYSPVGSVLFYTTNYPHLLDPVVRRSGRMDVEYLFDNATPNMVKKLFLRFFPDSSLGEQISEAYQGLDHAICMADLQGIFMRATNDAHALKTLKNHKKQEVIENGKALAS